LEWNKESTKKLRKKVKALLEACGEVERSRKNDDRLLGTLDT
jgi:hypothetical protein